MEIAVEFLGFSGTERAGLGFARQCLITIVILGLEIQVKNNAGQIGRERSPMRLHDAAENLSCGVRGFHHVSSIQQSNRKRQDAQIIYTSPYFLGTHQRSVYITASP